MPIVKPRTFRGTRDFLPGELLARRRILEVIEEAYRRYGFQPLETPAIEYLDILTGKSEENDKLIYEIKRARGDDEETAESAIALRYDLTVPLARVVAQYADLPRPFKRYQIQPVWRADRPQPRQGRFREFVQCDADIVGTDSLLADAEIIALTYEVLRDLGFEKFVIRLSSRKLLFGIVDVLPISVVNWSELSAEIQNSIRQETGIAFIRIIDKLEKIGWEKVSEELHKANIYADEARSLMQELQVAFSLGLFDRAERHLERSEQGQQGIQEIETVLANALKLGIPSDHIVCDPTLARGLDYYTGPIFETVLPDHPHIGSLSGGGRYDGLVSTFSKERVPATGTTIGLDRIQTALAQLGKFESATSTTQVLVTRFDDGGMAFGLELAAELRRAGIRTEVWYDDDRMKKQFAYADKQGIPLVVIAGPDERNRSAISVKNLKTAEQKEVSRVAAVETISALLRAL